MRDRSSFLSASSTVKRIAVACVAIAGWALSEAAAAASDVTLRALTRDGSWTRAELVSIADGTWRFIRPSSKDEQMIREDDVVAFIVERSRGASDAASDSEVPTPLSYGRPSSRMDSACPETSASCAMRTCGITAGSARFRSTSSRLPRFDFRVHALLIVVQKATRCCL